jgi:hypothetical protein
MISSYTVLAFSSSLILGAWSGPPSSILINHLTLKSTVSLIYSTFSSVFDIEGRPGRSSSSISS